MGLFAQTIVGWVARLNAYPESSMDSLRALITWLDNSLRRDRISMGDTDRFIKTLTLQLTDSAFATKRPTLFHVLQLVTEGRVFFVTETGAMGLAPASTKLGYTIHIFPSGRTHFMLRESATTGHLKKLAVYEPEQKHGKPAVESYELIGDCLYNNTLLPVPVRIPGFQGQRAGDEPPLQGSLPFELLETEFLGEADYGHVKSIWLV